MKKKYIIVPLIGLIILFLVLFYLNASSIEAVCYYQYFIAMFLCLVIGLTLSCVIGIFLFFVIISLFKTVTKLFRKKKSMKKMLRESKSELSSEFSLVFIILGTFIISTFFAGFGINGFLAIVKDKRHIEKPEIVILTNWMTETGQTHFVGPLPAPFRLIGEDPNEKEYTFIINGGIRKTIHSHQENFAEEKLYVYYLPNTNIVIKVE